MEDRDVDYTFKKIDVENIILSNENKIYSLCYYMLKNTEDARDAMQEVCIKIFKYINGFKGSSKLSTWIYRIAHNTCIDYMKKQRSDISYEDTIIQDIESKDRVQDIVEKRELQETVRSCILRLNEIYREVITLRDINGFTYEEIAGILDINIGTVKSRLNRGRIELKKELIKENILG